MYPFQANTEWQDAYATIIQFFIFYGKCIVLCIYLLFDTNYFLHYKTKNVSI